MKATGQVRLAVYDLLGCEDATLANGVREASNHKLSWTANDLPGDIYFLRMTTGNGFVAISKLVRMK